MPVPIIEAKGLTKQYGELKAVDDLSFSVLPGDIYGFLGQNGAGKSTTMRMLLGLVKPTAGEVFIKGESLKQKGTSLLKYIGAIIERPDMYGYLSGWDNLRMMANLSAQRIPDQRLHDILELVHLKGREGDKVKQYSQGMKQRLGIAISLVHDPELLILDEPTNGLDPQGIAQMRELILDLAKDHGKTILISSHLLFEMEQMATRMLIIHQGKKMVEGKVADLLNVQESIIEVQAERNENLRSVLAQSLWSNDVRSVTDGEAILKMDPAAAAELNAYLLENGIRVTQLKRRHSLEDYFLSLTNSNGHEVSAVA